MDAETKAGLAALARDVGRIADALTGTRSHDEHRARIERTLRDQDVARQIVANVCREMGAEARRKGQHPGFVGFTVEHLAQVIREMTFDQLLAGVD
jgi:hypothetical protein